LKPHLLNVMLFALLMLAVGTAGEPGGQVVFRNSGNSVNFTGGNQLSKVHTVTVPDHDGDHQAIECVMVKEQPDTPRGGCHAEVHLAKIGAEVFGSNAGFRYITRHWVTFDAGCEAADVGFWQLKNCTGARRWDHLVALWREAGQGGARILFQWNPTGDSKLYYARLNQATLQTNAWHEVEVKGDFNPRDGWAEVKLDGRLIEWFSDRACRNSVGARIRGPLLPDIADARWQLQLGGYGFFKSPGTSRATVLIDDLTVSTWK
jgi:hypothetical protein